MGLTRFLSRCLPGLIVLAAVSCAGKSVDRAPDAVGGSTGGGIGGSTAARGGDGGTTGGIGGFAGAPGGDGGVAGGVGGSTGALGGGGSVTGGRGGSKGALGGGGGVAGGGNVPGGGTGGTGGYEPGGGCDAVACPETEECSEGREFRRPAGACCWACVPVEPPACLEIACPQELDCAPGFAAGNGTNGCCYECVPDPLYCEGDDACVLAHNKGTCCGCAEGISRRLYEESACYSSVSEPRTVPEDCFPDDCAAADCGCTTSSDYVAVCENERCTAVPGPER